ncbi:MAG: M3 family metallopeptidase [Bacteroides sp.]|nr:M3 family metallopeptidase [Bacteroides sp.]MCM1379926.1 M3 family metallopeptidase [Bacteroides sp.]MCM1446219.1 M3 family metallopeptidase [Prevotella sp.]
MKKQYIFLAAVALVGATAVYVTAKDTMPSINRNNPLLSEYKTQYEIPPFEQIKVSDYMPALREAIAQQKNEVNAIIENPEVPTFNNTILALDNSGELLTKVSLLFSGLDEALNSPESEAVAADFYAEAQQWADEMSMNPKLFARIKAVYDKRNSLGLNTSQMRLVEQTYRDAVRNGALLSAADQDSLKAVNSRLTDLFLKYNKNLLAATNEFVINITDTTRLAGLPQGIVDAAAEAAAERNLPEGTYSFTLHAPSRLPVLQYAADRDLRRQVYDGYTSLASSGKYDNSPVINAIVRERTKKAKLLGYPDFASYATANVMAKTPEAAMDLLNKVWEAARIRVNEEVAEMQQLTDEKIMPWDYAYYAEKVRQLKYDLDEDELRQYFAVDSVLNGVFKMANTLYGVNFQELPDAPKYHPEVKVYDVTDAKTGEHIAVFMNDYFPRASKRQGAWMSEFKGAYKDENGNRITPIIYNVGNFTRPTATTPALLSIDDVETLFHEFGHGLHGMLTQAQYRSQAGTNVDRDFVELPSQIHEHWAVAPQMLKMYAHHWKTGEVIPDELIAKLQAALQHNQGFTTGELAGASILDLEWGKLNLEDGDSVNVLDFERSVAEKLQMPAELQFRYRSPYFKHVFGSDGYASGYYTYLWAEVLDSDGFELFEEKGIFDPATAESFKHNVLEAGGSDDPMKLYIQFRGRKPDVNALLRNRGLIK